MTDQNEKKASANLFDSLHKLTKDMENFTATYPELAALLPMMADMLRVNSGVIQELNTKVEILKEIVEDQHEKIEFLKELSVDSGLLDLANFNKEENKKLIN